MALRNINTESARSKEHAPNTLLKKNFLAVWKLLFLASHSCIVSLLTFFLCAFFVRPSVSLSDVLALPIFKQEDSSLPTENETKNPPFQYVLCAATSPAVKLHDETLTYLNQGEMQCSTQRNEVDCT